MLSMAIDTPGSPDEEHAAPLFDSVLGRRPRTDGTQMCIANRNLREHDFDPVHVTRARGAAPWVSPLDKRIAPGAQARPIEAPTRGWEVDPYLNVFVSLLQTGAGVASFLRRVRGFDVPASLLLAPLTRSFVASLERFARRDGIEVVRFRKGQRKDEVTQERLRRWPGAEGVLYIGKAREKALLRACAPRAARDALLQPASQFADLVPATAEFASRRGATSCLSPDRLRPLVAAARSTARRATSRSAAHPARTGTTPISRYADSFTPDPVWPGRI